MSAEPGDFFCFASPEEGVSIEYQITGPGYHPEGILCVKTRHWQGSAPVELITWRDIQELRTCLELLHRRPLEAASFSGEYSLLSLEFRPDGKGHFEVRSKASFDTFLREELNFRFHADQSALPEWIRQLKLIERKWMQP